MRSDRRPLRLLGELGSGAVLFLGPEGGSPGRERGDETFGIIRAVASAEAVAEENSSGLKGGWGLPFNLETSEGIAMFRGASLPLEHKSSVDHHER